MLTLIVTIVVSGRLASAAAADVVIVGAGVSGLTTAYELVKSGVPGSTITLVEQRDVSGGRVKNKPVPGFPGKHVEVGGTWIGGTQYRVAALSNELGLSFENGDFFHTYTAMNNTIMGKSAFLDDDGNACVPRSEAWPSENVTKPCMEVVPVPTNKQLELVRRLRAMAAEVGVEKPWASSLAHLDNMTVLEWLKSEGLVEVGKDFLNQLVAVPLNTDVSEMSMLFYLFFEASCPSFCDTAAKGGAQDYRFTKGSQHLPDLLRENVTRAGVRILWNTTVAHISNEPDHVNLSVLSSIGGKMSTLTLNASQAVVAMGTGDASRFNYSGITPMRQELHNRWIHDESGVKYFLIYKNAFWRKPFAHDASPRASPAVSILLSGVEYFDYSDQSGVPGILAGFFPTNGSTAQDREQLLAADVCLDTNLLGAPGACSHIGYIEQVWDMQHPAGGTSNIVQHMVPGTLTATGPAWRAPIGRLHWAGSDTAQLWMGYIDGAVESGIRAAKEVRDSLASHAESPVVV